ncbi:phosphoribosylanthranilate isomerase [Paenibacillus agricola]|uniref:N-(5'-phosphoribosyl)anthranilate isomerase n=1 Tax=Paenibacillus agricola TaxID=2716264 RepID=A0ABX0J0T4_9BACL|nr:phosphoribosylanthranilate isomerase [Paenibacillus agricola]NHN28714.1 phosphoribosylanthranilate isomerase [Paenibacillus agricola]
MSHVKICGLQQPAMVEAIMHLPIDYIGFVFAKSKRQVTSIQAGLMIEVLEGRRAIGLPAPLSVGVFVNPSQAELLSIMKEAKLDVIQLHGQESPELCRWAKDMFPRVEVWKVVSVVALEQVSGSHAAVGMEISGKPAANIMDSTVANSRVSDLLQPYQASVDAFLLDTFDPVYGGGSGKTFAWEAIPPYQAWCREAGLKLIVAGGLVADNVRELLDAYEPDGVDVSSGVETNGVKDIDQIIRFVERVKHRD